VAILIESEEGLANFDEIIAVPGVDIVAFGPFDLSQAMGYQGDWQHPEVQHRLEQLGARALAQNIQIMPSIFDTDPATLLKQIDHWRNLGTRIFVLSGDRFMLSAGFRAVHKAIAR
jgi:4-hydroxy-2-oxoheptanedioate aldolase